MGKILKVSDGELQLGDSVQLYYSNDEPSLRAACCRDPFFETDDWYWVYINPKNNSVMFRIIWETDKYNLIGHLTVH